MTLEVAVGEEGSLCGFAYAVDVELRLRLCRDGRRQGDEQDAERAVHGEGFVSALLILNGRIGKKTIKQVANSLSVWETSGFICAPSIYILLFCLSLPYTGRGDGSVHDSLSQLLSCHRLGANTLFNSETSAAAALLRPCTVAVPNARGESRMDHRFSSPTSSARKAAA